MRRFVLLLVSMFVPLSASAQDYEGQPLYWGLAITPMQYDDAVGALETFDLVGVTGRLGLDFGRYLGVEAQAGTTSSDENLLAGTDFDLGVDNFVSGYLRLNIPIERGRLYALAGWTAVEFAADANQFSIDDDYQEDLSWGLGVELYGNERTALDINYIRYLDEDETVLEGVSLGFVRRF